MIRLNPDTSVVREVLKGVKSTGGYCPCRTEKIAVNKCMCEEFRGQTSGLCYCGLYEKIEDME